MSRPLALSLSLAAIAFVAGCATSVPATAPAQVLVPVMYSLCANVMDRGHRRGET